MMKGKQTRELESSQTVNPARQKGAKTHASHISTRMWPLGHILAADPWPKPWIRGLLVEIRGVFAPLISSLLSPLGFGL